MSGSLSLSERVATLGRPLWATAIAWGVVVLVLVLIGIAIVLHVHNGETDLTSWWPGNGVVSLVLLVPGALLSVGRPSNAIGWLLLTASLTMALSAAGLEYLVFGVLGGPAPGHIAIGWVVDSLYTVSMLTQPLVLLLFPDGRLISRRARPVLVLPLISFATGAFSTLFASDPDGVDVQGHRLYNPARGIFPAWAADIAGSVSWLTFMLSIVSAVVLLVLRYRRASAEVRLQMRWVVWAGTISAAELVTEFIPGNQISQYTGPVAAALISLAVCVAILHHRLFDIDVVINRTVVYALLSAIVFGLYIAVMVAADRIFHQPAQLGPGLVAAAVIALAFGPLRSLLQAGVNRVMYGDRDDPYRVISRLGQRLEDARADELDVVVQTLTQVLKLPYAAVADPSGRLLAEHGRPEGDPLVVPLPYQGSVVGQLRLCSRRRQAGFDRREQELFADLARQIGTTVHALRLSDDLQASRARLVTAKEEERRRLRRDLHDGLGPKLAAIMLKTDLARTLVEERPEAGAELLAGMKDDMRETIADVRRLVSGLRPPALDELGLVGAVQEVADRFSVPLDGSAAALRVDVLAPPLLPALPAAVEVAAYRIVTEALTNVARHAQARRCSIVLAVDEEALVVRVIDDGVGVSNARLGGVGSTTMRERAEELGGRLAIDAGANGGTEVFARLPCGHGHDDER